MNGAVSALGESFAQNLLRASWPRGDYHHLAAVLFLLTQRLFERISVRLIDFVRDVFSDPGAALIQLERRVLLRHLLHADQNLHSCLGKLVSINPEANTKVTKANPRSQKHH